MAMPNDVGARVRGVVWLQLSCTGSGSLGLPFTPLMPNCGKNLLNHEM